MGDTAILLQYNEHQIPQLQGGYPDQEVAPYSFAEVDANNLPPGDNIAIGTLNGVQVYVADPCTDVSKMQADGQDVFSVMHMRVVDGEFESAGAHDAPGATFHDFDFKEFGDFVGDNQDGIDAAREGQEPELCHVASAEPLYEQVGGTALGMSVKI